MPPKRGSWFDEAVPDFHLIFDGRPYRKGTINGKKTHLSKFAKFVHNWLSQNGKYDVTGFSFEDWSANATEAE